MPRTSQNDYDKYKEQEEGRKIREARRRTLIIEGIAILILAGLVVALALSILSR